MKAILVIDLPNGYGDIADNKAVVTLRNGKLGTSLGIYNVPLKPLPKKFDLSEDRRDGTGHIASRVWYRRHQGWNDCLEEILK